MRVCVFFVVLMRQETCLFVGLVESVGEVTIHFMLLHGRMKIFRELSSLIRIKDPSKVSYDTVLPLLEKIKDQFLNWVVFNLSYSTLSGCKANMFERTLVAQRRGLSRDGREILASLGCLMKKTVYDETVKGSLRSMTEAQR